MRRKHLFLLLTALGLAAGPALGRKRAPQPEEVAAELGRAPAGAQASPNPFADKPDALLAGEKLYKQHCAVCHGPDARGREKTADLHSPVIQRATPGALVWFLRNGNLREGMPAWSRLPDAQLWQIVTYLKTLEPGESKPSRHD